MRKLTLFCVACLTSATVCAGNLRAHLKTVNYDADTVDITEAIDYVQADYYGSDEQHFFQFSVMNYDEEIPWLVLDIEAPAKDKIAGNYSNGVNIDLGYSDLTISDVDIIQLTKAAMTIKCVGIDDSLGEPVYEINITVDGENGKVYICHVTMSILAFDADENPYSFADTKTPETPTAITSAALADLYTQNGRIVCESEFRIYDLLGRDVTRLNGSLSGVYVVKTADTAVKVVVK
ncbi:MAG: hypothetical protein ACI392_04215 [Paludibacteraceae bacterium]